VVITLITPAGVLVVVQAVEGEGAGAEIEAAADDEVVQGVVEEGASAV